MINQLGVLLLPIFYLLIRNDHRKTLFFIALLSLICNLFVISIGGINVRYAQVISLMIIALKPHELKINRIHYFALAEIVLLIITVFYFSFVSPWDSVFADRLPLVQKPNVKGFIGFFRISLDVSLLFSAQYFRSIMSHNIVKYVLTIFAVQLIYGLIVPYIPAIDRLLFHSPPFGERLRGLNHEPRSIARNAFYALLFILIIGKNISWKKYITAAVTLVLSFSLSTFLGIIISVSLSTLLHIRSKKVMMRSIFIAVLCFLVISLPKFQRITKQKFDRVILESSTNNSSLSLEFYDMAFIRFISDNGQYLWLGVGPNLINLAYEKYAIQEWKVSHPTYYVSTGPVTSIFRLVSRSGIIGLILHIAIYYVWYRNQLNSTMWHLTLFIFFLIIYEPWLYFIIGSTVFHDKNLH
jgi:hypothetical protein